MAVTVTRGPAEAAGKNIRPEDTNGPDQIAQGNVVSMPFAERLVRVLGKAKIGDVGEALLHVVIFVRLQKFQRAADAELVSTLRADLVLSAFAAGGANQ